MSVLSSLCVMSMARHYACVVCKFYLISTKRRYICIIWGFFCEFVGKLLPLSPCG